MARIWLAILTFVFVAIAGARTADAQVFKARGKSGGAAKTAPKKDAPAAKKAPAARKTDTPSRVAAKTPKKSRAADSARPSDLTPDEAPARDAKKGKAPKGKAGKARKIEGEDEPSASAEIGDDEVIITDDDD